MVWKEVNFILSRNSLFSSDDKMNFYFLSYMSSEIKKIKIKKIPQAKIAMIMTTIKYCGYHRLNDIIKYINVLRWLVLLPRKQTLTHYYIYKQWENRTIYDINIFSNEPVTQCHSRQDYCKKYWSRLFDISLVFCVE